MPEYCFTKIVPIFVSTDFGVLIRNIKWLKGHFWSVEVVISIGCATWNSNLKSYLLYVIPEPNLSLWGYLLESNRMMWVSIKTLTKPLYYKQVDQSGICLCTCSRIIIIKLEQYNRGRVIAACTSHLFRVIFVYIYLCYIVPALSQAARTLPTSLILAYTTTGVSNVTLQVHYT